MLVHAGDARQGEREREGERGRERDEKRNYTFFVTWLTPGSEEAKVQLIVAAVEFLLGISEQGEMAMVDLSLLPQHQSGEKWKQRLHEGETASVWTRRLLPNVSLLFDETRTEAVEHSVRDRIPFIRCVGAPAGQSYANAHGRARNKNSTGRC